MGFHDELANTPFIAKVDPGLCDYCGECLRACNVKCIGLASDARGRAGRGAGKTARRYAEIDSAVYLGCGVCASACERGAVSLMKRRRYRRPPRSPAGLFARILWEKGRLVPFVAEGLRRHWRLPLLRRR